MIDPLPQQQSDSDAERHECLTLNICFCLCPFKIGILQSENKNLIFLFILNKLKRVNSKHTVCRTHSFNLWLSVYSGELLSIAITSLSGHGIDFQCLALSWGVGAEELTVLMLWAIIISSRAPPSGVNRKLDGQYKDTKTEYPFFSQHVLKTRPCKLWECLHFNCRHKSV